jgi:hypothetical protein
MNVKIPEAAAKKISHRSNLYKQKLIEADYYEVRINSKIACATLLVKLRIMKIVHLFSLISMEVRHYSS